MGKTCRLRCKSVSPPLVHTSPPQYAQDKTLKLRKGDTNIGLTVSVEDTALVSDRSFAVCSSMMTSKVFQKVTFIF